MSDPLELALVMLSVLAAGFIAFEMFKMGVATAPADKFGVEFSPDDPLILEAADKARATLPRFDALLLQYPRFSSLSLGPIGPGGTVTPALVKGRGADGSYIVRRARTFSDGTTVEDGDEFSCTAADIVDWMVYDNKFRDHIYGGFILRALLQIARRDGVYIPKHALRQEKKFVRDGAS